MKAIGVGPQKRFYAMIGLVVGSVMFIPQAIILAQDRGSEKHSSSLTVSEDQTQTAPMRGNNEIQTQAPP